MSFFRADVELGQRTEDDYFVWFFCLNHLLMPSPLGFGHGVWHDLSLNYPSLWSLQNWLSYQDRRGNTDVPNLCGTRSYPRSCARGGIPGFKEFAIWWWGTLSARKWFLRLKQSRFRPIYVSLCYSLKGKISEDQLWRPDPLDLWWYQQWVLMTPPGPLTTVSVPAWSFQSPGWFFCLFLESPTLSFLFLSESCPWLKAQLTFHSHY